MGVVSSAVKMFSNRFFRPAQQLSGHVRRYATEPPKSGGSGAGLYGAIGAAALGGGYWYMNQGSHGSVNESAAHGQPASKSQEQTTPAKAGPNAVKTFTGGDQGFIPLVLDSTEQVSHNTKKLRFKLSSEDAVAGLPVASALITKYKGPEMEKPVIRPYTPVSDEDQPGYLDFVVKKYPNGPMSEHIHNMNVGQSLDMKGPIFKYPDDKTKVTLVYGNVSEEDILLKKELQDLENKYPQRFRAFYLLDNPPEGWQQGKGFITKDVLKTVLPKEGNLKLFVCGPPGMYKAISGPKNSPADQGELSGYLAELGYNKDQVYKF